jgi:site-specific recombinase XerD
MAGLCLEDIDWKAGVVRFKQSKNQKLLWLPLSRPLIEALASYIETERPSKSIHRNVFLRLNVPWEPLTPGGLAGTISRRMHTAAIAGSCHQLRHSFASELLRVGTSFSTLQELQSIFDSFQRKIEQESDPTVQFRALSQYTFYHLLYACGLRVSEAIALTKSMYSSELQ